MKTEGSPANLKSVSARIGEAVREFVAEHINQQFFGEDLRVFVISRVGQVAPSSPTRILQDMRKRGELNYALLDRSKSLYEGLPMGSTVEGSQIQKGGGDGGQTQAEY